MDMDQDEALGGMSRPVLLVLLGIVGVASAFWYAREPSPVVEQPTAGVVTLNSPVNPVVAPAPPLPAAQPAGPGHWVWIPDRSPVNIPGMPQH